MPDEKKNLSTESKFNVVVLTLVTKHGIDLPEDFVADAAKDKDAREAAGLAEPAFAEGDKVTVAGDPTKYSVADLTYANGWNYKLDDKDGEFAENTLKKVEPPAEEKV